jgi:hypothetical protein
MHMDIHGSMDPCINGVSRLKVNLSCQFTFGNFLITDSKNLLKSFDRLGFERWLNVFIYGFIYWIFSPSNGWTCHFIRGQKVPIYCLPIIFRNEVDQMISKIFGVGDQKVTTGLSKTWSENSSAKTQRSSCVK